MTTEITPGGPSREEVKEVNRPKESKSKINTAANVLAASLTTAAGVGLAGTVQEALNSAPAPIAEQAPELDPLSRRSPEGVVFPQSPRADAPVEPVLKKRVFIPNVSKEYRELPLKFLREFGNLEVDNTVFINRGIEVGVMPGDQTLMENLSYLVRKYAPRPDIKRYIYFYQDLRQLQRESGIPYNYPHNVEFYPVTELFGPAERRWGKKQDGSLEFHIAIRTPKEGASKERATPYASGAITEWIWRSLWSGENGSFQLIDRYGEGPAPRGTPKGDDFVSHPYIAYDENGDQISAFKVIY